jgi:hypothetical protein
LRIDSFGNNISGGFMKFLIALVVIVGLSLGVWQIKNYYRTFQPKESASNQGPVEVAEDQLPGMPVSLQPALDVARSRGAVGLKEFLTAYGNTIEDPRRAAIELDYMVLEAVSNPSEARRVYAKVKGRLNSTSPEYARLQQLAKTYEN